MNLQNLNEVQITMLHDALNRSPIFTGSEKEETLRWIKLQKEEQLKGGPWKARIREQGFTI